MNGVRPAWCESRFGAGRALVVAPHGGVSRRDLLTREAAGRRANDLHTASLARELAGRLGGGLLVNGSRDRNELDLNRLPDVVENAPWFLAEIERHVERILAAHSTAVLLFVHGWHVGQARCDLGIGRSLGSATDAAARAEALTVSPEFAQRELESFRRSLEAAGVLATWGERWPAAHRDNVMRLFRRTADADPPRPRLARWVAEGRVEAIQLELGAPLRWPGALRRALVEAAVAFGQGRGERPPEPGVRAAEVVPPASNDERWALGLQAFDGACGDRGLGLVMGAVRMNRRDVGARLQLFPGGQRMAIFTGHGRAGSRLGVPGLFFEPEPGGLRAHFEGWVLQVPDATSYFRFEERQADAALVQASVRVVYREQAGGVGRLQGQVRLDGTTLDVDAPALSDALALRPAGPGTLLVATLGPARAVRVHADGVGETASFARLEAGGWGEDSADARLSHEADGRVTLHLPDRRPLRIRTHTRVSMLRPVGPRKYVHSTLGVGGVEGEPGAACFYEQRRPL